jgi:hypothetical protein
LIIITFAAHYQNFALQKHSFSSKSISQYQDILLLRRKTHKQFPHNPAS